MPKRRHILKNVFIFKDRTLKKIILRGREFRCGSDEKMLRTWFGLEIDVVGLPPLTLLPLILFHIKQIRRAGKKIKEEEKLKITIELVKFYLFINKVW